MWCASCQADVAPEIADDHRHIYCASCRATREAATDEPRDQSPRDARELLRRWTDQSLLDPFQAVDASHDTPPDAPQSEVASEMDPPSTQAGSPQWQPADTPPAVAPLTPPAGVSSVGATDRQVSTDAAAQSHLPPNFDAPIEHRHLPRRKMNWMSPWGQCLAYGGVLALMFGTVLILWGYFGGKQGVMPTGWLILTAGQMLLFLGVVTLITGGMEQTTAEVVQRIDELRDQLLEGHVHQPERGAATQIPTAAAAHLRPQPSASRVAAFDDADRRAA